MINLKILFSLIEDPKPISRQPTVNSVLKTPYADLVVFQLLTSIHPLKNMPLPEYNLGRYFCDDLIQEEKEYAETFSGEKHDHIGNETLSQFNESSLGSECDGSEYSDSGYSNVICNISQYNIKHEAERYADGSFSDNCVHYSYHTDTNDSFSKEYKPRRYSCHF